MRTQTLGAIAAASLPVMAATFAACDRNESPAEPVAGSCSATIPPQLGFQPSAPWPATYPHGSAWYGTDELWTFLATDGDHGRRKSVWWSAKFGGGALEPTPDLGVVWRRIDGDAPRVIQEDPPEPTPSLTTMAGP